MSKMNVEEFKAATEGQGMDDVIAVIKETPLYEAYQSSVKTGTEDTSKMLEMITMLQTVTNERFQAMMTNVAIELLFAMIDQKLRTEILEQAGEKEGA